MGGRFNSMGGSFNRKVLGDHQKRRLLSCGAAPTERVQINQHASAAPSEVLRATIEGREPSLLSAASVELPVARGAVTPPATWRAPMRSPRVSTVGEVHSSGLSPKATLALMTQARSRAPWVSYSRELTPHEGRMRTRHVLRLQGVDPAVAAGLGVMPM